MTFTYDLLSWMLFDRFALGRAIYLESDKDFSILSTTLHQFWYLPLVCCVVYCEYSGQLRLMKRYWIFSVILSFMLAFYAKTHFEEQRVVFGTPITFVPDFGSYHLLESLKHTTFTIKLSIYVLTEARYCKFFGGKKFFSIFRPCNMF